MKRLKYILSFILLILFIVFLTSCSTFKTENSFLEDNSKSFLDEKNFVIFFVDVGQGDCILIKTPQNRFILVDSGPNVAESKVLSFFDSLNIKKFDIIIATHPHEDHIGNMLQIISKYEVGQFYTINKTTNTQTFEDMLRAIKGKKLRINIIQPFERIDINGVVLTFISPLKEYEDLNESSAVMMVEYGNRRILLTGDISKEVEYDILRANIDVRADILKVAHHGSYSATSKRFLRAVLPKVAVISVGKDNPYGHPHKSTIKALDDQHIKVLTTMDKGDIAFVINSKMDIELYTQK